MIKPFITDKIISLVEQKISKGEFANEDFIEEIVHEISENNHLGCHVKRDDNIKAFGDYYQIFNVIFYNFKKIMNQNYDHVDNILFALSVVIHETTHAYLTKYELDNPIANRIIETYDDNLGKLLDDLTEEDEDKKKNSFEGLKKVSLAKKEYYYWDIHERIAHHNTFENIYLIANLLVPKRASSINKYTPLCPIDSYEEMSLIDGITIAPSIEFLVKCDFKKPAYSNFEKYYKNRLEFYKKICESISLKDRHTYGLPISKSELIELGGNTPVRKRTINR